VLIITCSAGLFAWSLTDWIFLKPIRPILPIISFISIVWFTTIISGATLNIGYPFNYNGILFYLVVFYFLVYFLLKKYAKFYRK
jgi:amino acid transporter